MRLHVKKQKSVSEDMVALTALINQNNQKVDDLNDVIKSKNDLIKSKEKKIANLSEEIRSLKETVLSLSGNIDILQESIKKHEIAESVALKKMEMAEEDYFRKINNIKDEKEAIVSSYKKKIEKANIDLSEILLQVKEEKLFLNGYKDQNSELKKEKADLERGKIALISEINELEEIINKKEKRSADIDKNINSSELKIEDLKFDIGVLSEQKEKLLSMSKAVESDIEKKKKDLVEVEEKFQEQQDKFLSLLAREKRVNELVPKLKELFKQAGYNNIKGL